jgi:hypothetical protein
MFSLVPNGADNLDKKPQLFGSELIRLLAALLPFFGALMEDYFR